MAPLTWRNVSAPDFNSAARILDQAGQRIESGFGNIAGTLQDARERQRQQASAEAIGILAGVKGEGDVDAALAAVLNGTASRNMTPELVQAIGNIQGHALGLDSQRVQNRNNESLIADRLHAQGIKDGQLALAQSADSRAWSQHGIELDKHGIYMRDDNNNQLQGQALASTALMGGHLSPTQQAAYGIPDGFDFSNYASGGATRGDSFSGMRPEMQAGLAGLLSTADSEIGRGLGVFSGYRSADVQAGIVSSRMQQYGFSAADKAQWDADVASMGAEAAGQKWRPRMREAGLTQWIAMPGGSKHQTGQAADLTWNGQRLDQAPQEVQDWVRENAGRFGLDVPMAHEPWQVETADARGGAAPGSGTPAPVFGRESRIDQALQSYLAQGGTFTPASLSAFLQQNEALIGAADQRLIGDLQERQNIVNRNLLEAMLPDLSPQSIDHAREDLTRRIRGMDATPQQKDALLQEGMRLIEANADRWSAGTNVDTFDTLVEMEGLVDPELGTEGALAIGGASVLRNNLANIEQAASVLPRYDQDVGALFGEGAVGTQVSQAQVLKFFEDSFNSDELYRADLDSMADSLLQISADTGVPMQYLAQHAMNAIGNRHNYNQQLIIDEDALRGQIGHLLGENGRFDQNKLFDVMTRAREMSQIQEDAQGQMAKRALLEERARILLNREGGQVTDRNRGALQQLMREMVVINDDIRGLSEQARTSAGVKTEAQAKQERFQAQVDAMMEEFGMPPAPRDPSLIQPTDRVAEAEAQGAFINNALNRFGGFVGGGVTSAMGGINDAQSWLLRGFGNAEGAAQAEARSDQLYNMSTDLFTRGLIADQPTTRNRADYDFEPGQYSAELVEQRRQQRLVSLAKSGVYSVAQLAEALGISLAEAQRRVSAR